MSKRKIVIFKFVPEIEKNAKRVSEGKYGYIVMQNGQSLTEFKYA